MRATCIAASLVLGLAACSISAGRANRSDQSKCIQLTAPPNLSGTILLLAGPREGSQDIYRLTLKPCRFDRLTTSSPGAAFGSVSTNGREVIVSQVIRGGDKLRRLTSTGLVPLPGFGDAQAQGPAVLRDGSVVYSDPVPSGKDPVTGSVHFIEYLRKFDPATRTNSIVAQAPGSQVGGFGGAADGPDGSLAYIESSADYNHLTLIVSSSDGAARRIPNVLRGD